MDVLFEIFEITAEHMSLSSSKMDPLNLRSHTEAFDDGFIEGNVTFASTRLRKLSTFAPNAVSIEWQSNSLWLRLEIDVLEISSVFHIDGMFEDLTLGHGVEDGEGVVEGEMVKVGLEEVVVVGGVKEEVQNVRKQEVVGKKMKIIVEAEKVVTVAGAEEKKKKVEMDNNNNIEVVGYSQMEYNDVEIDIHATLGLDKDGFLHITKMWTSMEYWYSVCKVSSYFPGEWVRHLICSMDEFDVNAAEISLVFDKYILQDVNRQMRQRGMKPPQFL